MLEATTEITINDTSYQIGRLPAAAGSWIVLQVLPKVTTAFMTAQGARQNEDEYSLALIGSIFGQFSDLDEFTFQRIQAHALSVCRRIEKGVPMPVFVPPNTWAAKELENDIMTVMSLTTHALVFNLSPFFDANGLKNLFPTPSPDTTQPTPQT